jgi:very-short-patch-repair endonuclease
MPQKRTTRTGYHNAIDLRNELTLAERRLWNHLKLKQVDGVRFRRQHAIGPYVVDFCAVKAKLVIELDGSQHIDQEDYDRERTEFLQSKKFRVIRFWNNDVMNNLDGVMIEIEEALKNSPAPTQHLLVTS